MAKSYGDDLRRKLLQAHDRGEGTLEQLAERFSVSAPWAWKISAQRKRSGQMERVEQRRGTVRKVNRCSTSVVLRSLKARTAEALEQAVTQALPCITPDNARSWFRHCGVNYIP
jgi:transposase